MVTGVKQKQKKKLKKRCDIMLNCSYGLSQHHRENNYHCGAQRLVSLLRNTAVHAGPLSQRCRLTRLLKTLSGRAAI